MSSSSSVRWKARFYFGCVPFVYATGSLSYLSQKILTTTCFMEDLP